jgi:hypothetical protein
MLFRAHPPATSPRRVEVTFQTPLPIPRKNVPEPQQSQHSRPLFSTFADERSEMAAIPIQLIG